MALFQTFETTVFDSEVSDVGEVLVLPQASLPPFLTPLPVDDRGFEFTEMLGVRPGPTVPNVEALPTVFFASMAGRGAIFDEGSFGRWERQMHEVAQDPRVRFANDLVFADLIPVEQSALRKLSLASIVTRGTAFVIATDQAIAGHPLEAIGVLALGEDRTAGRGSQSGCARNHRGSRAISPTSIPWRASGLEASGGVNPSNAHVTAAPRVRSRARRPRRLGRRHPPTSPVGARERALLTPSTKGRMFLDERAAFGNRSIDAGSAWPPGSTSV